MDYDLPLIHFPCDLIAQFDGDAPEGVVPQRHISSALWHVGETLFLYYLLGTASRLLAMRMLGLKPGILPSTMASFQLVDGVLRSYGGFAAWRS